MDNNELIEYYKDLLIIQYKQDKIESHIEAVIKPLVFFELIEDVKNAYNIDTAVGVQLNKLGKIIGLSRNMSDGTTVTILGDDDYRFYLKFKIVKNFSNHSMYSIDTMLYDFFVNQVKCIDNFDMTVMYEILDETLILPKTLKYMGLFPRGTGVMVDILAKTDNPFVFDGNDEGEGFGKLSDDDYELLDVNGDAVLDTEGNSIFVLVNESDPDDEGGELSVIIDQ